MKQDEAYRIAEGKLKAYIDAHGMRHTQERLMLLRHICDLPKHFTAEELVQLAEQDHISQATVYNALSLFADIHILFCLNRQYGRKRAEYELLVHGDSHTQIICERCGRVSDFNDTAIRNILKSRKFSNFNMLHYSLYVYGQCKVCRRLIMQQGDKKKK